MIATLSFTLPDERAEHTLACNALQLASSLDTIRRCLRNLDKSDGEIQDFKNCISSIELEFSELNIPILDI